MFVFISIGYVDRVRDPAEVPALVLPAVGYAGLAGVVGSVLAQRRTCIHVRLMLWRWFFLYCTEWYGNPH